MLAAADDPEADAIRERRAQRVAAELQRLTPTARVALVLQVREGLSYEEIAVRMNASRRMVKRYLLEAYAQLRARMPPDI